MKKITFIFKPKAEILAMPLIIKQYHTSNKKFAVNFPELKYGKDRALGGVLEIYTNDEDVILSKKMRKIVNEYVKKFKMEDIEKIGNFVGFAKMNCMHNTSQSYIRNFLKKYEKRKEMPKKSKFLTKIIKLYETYKKEYENVEDIIVSIADKLKKDTKKVCGFSLKEVPFLKYDSKSRGYTVPIFLKQINIQNFDLNNFNSFGLLKRK